MSQPIPIALTADSAGTHFFDGMALTAEDFRKTATMKQAMLTRSMAVLNGRRCGFLVTEPADDPIGRNGNRYYLKSGSQFLTPEGIVLEASVRSADIVATTEDPVIIKTGYDRDRDCYTAELLQVSSDVAKMHKGVVFAPEPTLYQLKATPDGRALCEHLSQILGNFIKKTSSLNTANMAKTTLYFVTARLRSVLDEPSITAAAVKEYLDLIGVIEGHEFAKDHERWDPRTAAGLKILVAAIEQALGVDLLPYEYQYLNAIYRRTSTRTIPKDSRNPIILCSGITTPFGKDTVYQLKVNATENIPIKLIQSLIEPKQHFFQFQGTTGKDYQINLPAEQAWIGAEADAAISLYLLQPTI